jgi:3-keto-L-gulonate-6-phosphate decarboxylase
MKLQISFDTTNLENALEVASLVAPNADILEIGTLLIYAHGIVAVEKFKDAFPTKTILVDTKIIDRAKDAVTLFSKAGADWITVMAGTDKNVIHTACSTAREFNTKVMLDLLDSNAVGQSALEANMLGVDAIVFHHLLDEKAPFSFLENWEIIRGNTDLPVFISGKITQDNIDEILQIKANGLIIGKSIIESADPAQQAQLFYEKISAV